MNEVTPETLAAVRALLARDDVSPNGLYGPAPPPPVIIPKHVLDWFGKRTEGELNTLLVMIQRAQAREAVGGFMRLVGVTIGSMAAATAGVIALRDFFAPAFRWLGGGKIP